MMYGFIPKVDLAEKMSKDFKIQLRSSYIDLTRDLHDYKPDLFPMQINEHFSNIKDEKINGFHSVVYHKSITLLNEEKYIDAKELIESTIGELEIPREKLLKTKDINNKILKIIFNEATLGLEHLDIHLEVMDNSSEEKAIENLKYGISILRESNPELLKEIDHLVSSVVFFTSNKGSENSKLLSLTSSSMQSLIMIEGNHDNSWIFLLDKYIHEGSHSLLFSLNLKEEFFYNSDDERYESPLRKDLRPLPGIYHATFVIQRLIYAFHSILSYGCINIKDRVTIENLINHYTEKVECGYNTVMKYGKLSPLAIDIIEKGQSYIYDNGLSQHHTPHIV